MPTPLTFSTLAPDPTVPRTERFSSGLPELDRVLGSGWVRGAVYLLSGDPGSGKSTLLLRAAATTAAQTDASAVYLTAEEAAAQVQARAARLGIAAAPVSLAETDDLTAAIAALIPPSAALPRLVIVDSVQRMADPTLPDAEPGSVRQVRAVARAAVRFARATAATVVLVCHETKGGRAAGPNALFHDVDAVLHLAVSDHLRVLTAKKNRYGATDAVGLLRMTPTGLVGLTEVSK